MRPKIKFQANDVAGQHDKRVITRDTAKYWQMFSSCTPVGVYMSDEEHFFDKIKIKLSICFENFTGTRPFS